MGKEQINFQASEGLIDRLDKQAENELTDRSTICRKAVDRYCEDLPENGE